LSGRRPERESFLSWLVLLVVALTAGLLTAPAAHAITLKVTSIRADGAKPSGGPAYEIGVSGPFVDGDTDRLAEALEGLRQRGGLARGEPLAIIVFDSKGGALEEGMRMGRLLRKWNLGTLVRAGRQCLSACALAFLGGSKPGLLAPEPNRSLEFGAALGFHAFYAPPNVNARDAATNRARGVSEGRAAAALVIGYVMEMGADPEHLLGALVKAPDEFLYIETAGEFASLAVCPIGLPQSRATLVERAVNVCTNVTRGVLPALPDAAVEYTPVEARRLLIAKIAGDAAQANVRSGIAARLQQILRGGRGTEAIYDELSAAGLPLPPMRSRAYNLEVPGIAVSCLATLSPSDPADYGVVLLTPLGVAGPRATAPPLCPGLFLYGHEEIINRSIHALTDRK
jgi:hypothetical protein